MNDFLSVLQKNSGVLWKAALEHVELSFSAVMFGVVIAVPLGIILTRNLKIGKRVLAVLGILQTVPSMVMFGLLLPAFGIGKLTARIVLAIYSILPILRNTYTGILEVPQDLTEAATGMGMDRFQVLFRVKLPVALPVIFAGIRLSSVYIISWATVAAIIGGGGLGDITTPWCFLSNTCKPACYCNELYSREAFNLGNSKRYKEERQWQNLCIE